MILNTEKEDVYIRMGINMPYGVMCLYYKGEELYERMLMDIMNYKYKPINRIYIKDNLKNVSRLQNLGMSSGKIYKIISNNSNKIYIGSTYKCLEDRLKQHETDYNNYKVCGHNYISSFEVLKNGNYSIVLIEDLGNIDRLVMEERESIYIKNNLEISVNIIDPKSHHLLYDNSIERKTRTNNKKHLLVNDIIKYIIENNENINNMEDMYKIYMKRRIYWNNIE
jgi:hypothetical protein